MSEQNTNRTVRTLKSLAVVAAAALAGSATVSRGAAIVVMPGATTGVNDVTSIGVQVDPGAATSAGTVTAVGGVGAAFRTGTSYTVNYANTVDKVEDITAGGTTYAAFGFANNVIERSTGAPNDIVWETGTVSGSTINLTGLSVSGDHEMLDTNAINQGLDNVFSTQVGTSGANPVGNNTNVARVDLLFTSGLKTAANSSFFVTDRGNVDQHDPFAVAAITSLDANGNPASYGPLLQLNAFTWGNTDLTGNPANITLRTDLDVPNDPLHPSDEEIEGVGGVAITTAELAGATGETIYGYSLFSTDLKVTGNGSGTQLDNYTNGNVYGNDDSTDVGGGLDPASTLAVLYVAVPEPTTAAIAGVAACGLLLGRRRRAMA